MQDQEGQNISIVRHFKSLRFLWLGHVERMESERTLKYLLNKNSVRKKGGPRKRCLQDVEYNFKRVKIRG